MNKIYDFLGNMFGSLIEAGIWGGFLWIIVDIMTSIKTFPKFLELWFVWFLGFWGLNSIRKWNKSKAYNLKRKQMIDDIVDNLPYYRRINGKWLKCEPESKECTTSTTSDHQT